MITSDVPYVATPRARASSPRRPHEQAAKRPLSAQQVPGPREKRGIGRSREPQEAGNHESRISENPKCSHDSREISRSKRRVPQDARSDAIEHIEEVAG